MRIRIFILFAIAGVALPVFQSCTRTIKDNYTAVGLEYFPYEKGNVRTYIYDSTHYNALLKKTETFRFTVKETVTDTFTDQQNQLNYRIERYYTPDTGKNYYFMDLRAVTWNSYGVQTWNQNKRIVNLSFPIKEKRWWNANIYNTDDEQRYTYGPVGRAYANNWQSWDQTVMVEKKYDSTFIAIAQEREIYAKDVGMVYQLNRNLDLTDPNNYPDGFVVVWSLYSYKK
ncbi:MAG: hypothetical protein JNL57_05310 [Bacteroidetes bacterium]|nr:hypothetical protein [Bacteroidota bacterium]